MTIGANSDACPAQYGRVELRLLSTGEPVPSFETFFLALEVRSA